jgi:hypothetical protein
VVIEWDDRTLEATVDRVAPEVESASSSIVMEAVIVTRLADGSERNALAGRVVGVRLAGGAAASPELSPKTSRPRVRGRG